MSRDRVKFNFCDNRQERHENIRAAIRAFGINTEQAGGAFECGSRIVCRPSQFARFIIYRIEEGITINRIAQLKPVLFTPTPSRGKVLDVSMNEHQVGEGYRVYRTYS